MEYFEYLISVIIRQLDTNKGHQRIFKVPWTDGDTRQIRAFQNMIPTNQSKSLLVIPLDNIDAKIGDVITVTIMASEFSIKIIDSVNYFPTLYPDTEPCNCRTN